MMIDFFGVKLFDLGDINSKEKAKEEKLESKGGSYPKGTRPPPPPSMATVKKRGGYDPELGAETPQWSTAS